MKAEFDSLKNDFQTQIDQYNSNIDSKIDGAIASYLAGITVGKQSTLLNCSGIIEYPLTLRHLGPYAGNDVIDIKTLNNAARLWTDDYDIELNNQRHAVSAFVRQTIKKNPNNRIKNFYNGFQNGSYFQIDDMWNNYNVLGILNSNYHHFSDPAGPWEYWGWNIFMDVKTDATSGGQQQMNSWMRTAFATNERKLTLPTNTRPCYLATWGQYGVAAAPKTYPSLTSSSSSKKWDKITVTAGTGFYEPTVCWVTWSQDAEKEVGKLNEIMISNARGADYRELFLPVLYSGKVKVTNIETAKTNLNPTYQWMTTNVNGTQSTSQTYVSMQAVIDPGYVINCESNLAAADSWEEASLIRGERVIYGLTTPYTKKVVGCTMGEGVLLTELNDDVKSMELSFTPIWDSTKETTISAKKYILLSKQPITEDMTNIADSANPSKYIDISTSKDEGAEKYKLIELTNNVENKIYSNAEMKKHDLIYYKIVWGYDSGNNNRWEEVVTIDEPKVVVTKKQ